VGLFYTLSFPPEWALVYIPSCHESLGNYKRGRYFIGVLGLEGGDVVVLAAVAATEFGISFKRGGRRQQCGGGRSWK
jgi:hypothetical protein